MTSGKKAIRTARSSDDIYIDHGGGEPGLQTASAWEAIYVQSPRESALLNYIFDALAGSNTGSIQKTQDLIDFCALNKIKPEITKISMNGIDDAWTKVSDKQARFHLGKATLKPAFKTFCKSLKFLYSADSMLLGVSRGL